MNRDDVDTFEKLNAQLVSLHQELTMLAKKKPNDAVNKFKIKFVNSALQLCNKFFSDTYRPFEDFTEFDVEDLPSNSDVTFILAQYIECAEKFRSDNIRLAPSSTRWVWVTDDINQNDADSIRTGIRTSPPKKLDER